MHYLLPAILAIAPMAKGAETPGAATTITEKAETGLLRLTAEFGDRADTLAQLRQALENGEDPNIQDEAGNTPLLHLCDALEMDYRYRTDPHYAQETNEAIILLLRHGADALQENKAGCNALFYMQSKPALLNELRKEKLLPKDLAVRIPYEPAALNRYIRLRLRQSELTTHPENRHYLIRLYCAPAYERVLKQLQAYLKAETASRIPTNALKEHLAFLRLADQTEAEKYINNLPLWEHAEHFLEEIPALLLTSLRQLEWEISPQRLHQALEKLESMLPRTPDEMIDCHAALPMGHILEMLYRQEGEQMLPTLRRYTASRDSELAYSAYRILLKRAHLPQPTPESLEEAIGQENGALPENAPSIQRAIYACALTDSSLRKKDLSRLTPALLQQAEEEYRALGLERHADLLATLHPDGEIATAPHLLEQTLTAYLELSPPCPRVTLARYILEHPITFTPKQQHENSGT